MTEPGWYVDYENPKQMRFHDGTAWTHHVHADRKNLPPSPVVAAPVAQADPVQGADDSQSSILVTVAGIAFIGAFVGLMFGGFLFNGIGSITPLTEHRGTVERIEVDYSSTGSTTSRRSYVISGSTEGGGDWRIVDEDAYRVLEVEGYPQDVIVSMGDWSDSAERVVGTSFTIDHQSTGARIGWGIALGAMALAALAGAIGIGRSKSGGLLGALVFTIAFFGPGTWLGYQAFQWVQSP